jgi:hypothetical protein
MDLFGRKAKAQAEVLAYWLVEKDERIKALATSSQSKDRIIEKLREHIFHLEARLYQAPDPPPIQPMRPLSPVRDEEVELEYALRNGDIDRGQYEDLLRATGFENTEVELPERAERPIVY